MILTTSFHGKSEDINKNAYFKNFSYFKFLGFQVMHDYVCFITLVDYSTLLNKVLYTRLSVKIAMISY